jgi:hypothetical protein
MNTQRIFEAMALKVSLDQKKLDDQLERVINSDAPLEDTITDLGVVLQKMVNLDKIIEKLNEVVQVINNNNKDVDKHRDTKNN